MLVFGDKCRLMLYARRKCFCKESIDEEKIQDPSETIDSNALIHDTEVEKVSEKSAASTNFQKHIHKDLLHHGDNISTIRENGRTCNVSGSESEQTYKEEHNLLQIPSTEKKKYPTKRCIICLDINKRKETRYYCTTCMNNPPLCKSKCFELYHKHQ